MISNVSPKTLIATLFAASIVGLASGYYFSNSYELGLCLADFASNTFDVSCADFFEGFGRPLFYGMGALSASLLAVLLYAKSFSVWWKFAVVAVPLIAILFAVWPTSTGGGIGVVPSFIGPPAVTVYKWVSAAFFVATLGIMGWVALKR